jgi:hypothetical protein
MPAEFWNVPFRYSSWLKEQFVAHQSIFGHWEADEPTIKSGKHIR